MLWRAGLRICEALALAESDLDPNRGSILVRRGKGGRRREVGMDSWAFDQLDRWVETRHRLPVGSVFCMVRGPTRGRPCSTPAIRVQLRDIAAKAGAPPRATRITNASVHELVAPGLETLEAERWEYHLTQERHRNHSSR